MLKIFETRNKKISDLIKLGDYLGYSIRENVQLFSMDGVEKVVTYLTENNQIISGNYLVNNNSYILENIVIQDSSIFTDDEKFDHGVSNQISLFLESLYHDEYTSAENTFSDVVDILTSRTHHSNISEKLKKKTAIFSNSHSILESTEFGRFVEVIPELVQFLAENQEGIKTQVPEILNSLKLSEAVANAFNVPMLKLEDLQKASRFEFTDNSKKSIYEMICKQELIKKELLEAKSSFDLVWADTAVIDNLSSKVFATDQEVEQALTEAIKELPYIALISKKKLFETLSRNIGCQTDHISEKELKGYASRLFEMKKPARDQLTHLLSEKYGVNLQYLKESHSYKSLINTQVVLFESLSRIAPKNSVLKEVLTEFSSELKGKDGIQSIDINNIIQQIFQHADYSKETIPLMESFSFDEIKKSFEKATNLVENDSEDGDSSEGDEESETPEKPKKKKKKKSKKHGKKSKEDEEDDKQEDDDDQEDEADTGKVQEEEVEEVSDEEKEAAEAPKMSDDEMMKAIKDLTDVINGVDIDYDQKENQ